jgi:hypothetical protein
VFLCAAGVGPYVGFVVILNNGQDVFIEHRSDTFFPVEINLKNVRACFKNIAEHIFSSITRIKHYVSSLKKGFENYYN